MEELFYAVVFACVGGVCEPYVLAKEPQKLIDCVAFAAEEKEKFLRIDKNAIATCVANVEYE